jgi:hypothetical protein
MYPVDDKDSVVEIIGAPKLSPGAPCPIVLCDEHSLILSYIIFEKYPAPPPRPGGGLQVIFSDPSQTKWAIVEFHRPTAHMFGPPNDEAFSGHPLASRGLGPYAIYEVRNSSWVRQLESMNSVHPQHNPKAYDDLKHYVFAFHDSTFECIARGFNATIVTGPEKLILDRMRANITSQSEDLVQ